MTAAVALLGPLLLLGVPASADEGTGPTLSLAELLARVQGENAAVTIAQNELRGYEAVYLRAATAWLPVIKVESLLAPLPERRLLRQCAYSGGPFALDGISQVAPCPGEDPSDDEHLTADTDIGVLTRTKASVTLPLYTFGKLDAAKLAAEQGVEVGRASVDLSRMHLTHLVKQAYYGALLTADALEILEDGRRRLEKAKKQIEGELVRETGRFTSNDLRKLEVQAGELEAGYLETNALSRVSREGLRLAAGLAPGSPFTLDVDELSGVDAPERDESAWLKDATETRADLRMAAAAVQARHHQVELATAEYYPDIALVGAFGYAKGTTAENSPDPYAKDEYNFSSWGVVLGAEWKLDFAARRGKLQEAEAAQGKATAQREGLLQKVRLDVFEAAGHLERYRAETAARKKAMKAGKGWLVSNTMNFGAGLAETDELLESLIAYSKARLAYIRALYEFNLAAARLSLAVGREIVVPPAATSAGAPTSPSE